MFLLFHIFLVTDQSDTERIQTIPNDKEQVTDVSSTLTLSFISELDDNDKYNFRVCSLKY